MRKLMNLILGMVVVRLTGPFPERLINLCAQEGIDFWAMDWLDEHTIRLTTRRYTLGRFLELAGRAGCEVEPARFCKPVPHPVCLFGGAGLRPVRGKRFVPLCAHHPGERE